MAPIGFGTLTGARSFGRGWQTTGAIAAFTGTYVGSAQIGSTIPNFISSTPSWSSNAMVGAFPAKSIGYATDGDTEHFMTVWVGNSGHSVYAIRSYVSSSGVTTDGSAQTLWSPGSSWTVADLDIAYNEASGRILATWSAYYSYGGFRSRLEYRDVYGAMWVKNGTSMPNNENIGSSIVRMYNGGYAYGYHECNGCNPYTTDSSVMDIGMENDNNSGWFRWRGYNYAGYITNNLGGSEWNTTDTYTQAYRRSVAAGPTGTNNNILVSSSNVTNNNISNLRPQSYDGNDAGHSANYNATNTILGASEIARAGEGKYLWLRRNNLALINYTGSSTVSSAATLSLTEGASVTAWNSLEVRPDTYNGSTGSWAAVTSENSSAAASARLHFGTYTSSSLTLDGTSSLLESGQCGWASPAWGYNSNSSVPSKLLLTGRDYSTGYPELHAFV